MKRFAFAESKEPPFCGKLFYEMFKNAEFLQEEKNVVTILSKGYQLRQALKGVRPGETVCMQGMWINKRNRQLLLVKKGGPNVAIKNNEFTANRLTGMTAAFVYENRLKYPNLVAAEAELLGIRWDSQDPIFSNLYLATVSGTEHFYEQFCFWPLVAALKKFQMKKITLEPIVKVARIKNSAGVRYGEEMLRNITVAEVLWSHFSVGKYNFKKMLRSLPSELKVMFG
ncbi:unnamed protein product [Leptosia nina]|uniref:Uncharacterized protein n=1 Tax=Leptosia nina TaxID=320188 RepID=A0AAV1IY55_9NEOP